MDEFRCCDWLKCLATKDPAGSSYQNMCALWLFLRYIYLLITGLKCGKKITLWSTPPLPVWTMTWGMLVPSFSVFLHQILTLPSKWHCSNFYLSDQAGLFPYSVVWFWWVSVPSVSCSSWTGAAHDVVFCCCSTFASSFGAFRDALCCNDLLFQLLLSFNLREVWLLPVNKSYYPENSCSLGILCFSNHSL